MLNEISQLKDCFYNISNKGWIRSVGGGNGAVGLTFEKELNKKFDNNFFPDFNGIEIKCTTRYSRFPYSLFSISFDGPSFPEVNRVIEQYGYNDYKFLDKKVFKVDLKTNQVNKCNNHLFKFVIEDNKLYMAVLDFNGVLIEKKSFVYLDSLLERFYLKLSKLVIIHSSKKKDGDDIYFRYYKFESFEAKSKEVFLELLQAGVIFATFESRVAKSGKDFGKYKNKNLVFKIRKEDLYKLFTKYNEINVDYNINRVIGNKCDFYIMQ